MGLALRSGYFDWTVKIVDVQWVCHTADSTSCDLSEGDVILKGKKENTKRKSNKWRDGIWASLSGHLYLDSYRNTWPWVNICFFLVFQYFLCINLKLWVTTATLIFESIPFSPLLQCFILLQNPPLTNQCDEIQNIKENILNGKQAVERILVRSSGRTRLVVDTICFDFIIQPQIASGCWASGWGMGEVASLGCAFFLNFVN